jgi:hypothetical protein
MGAKVTKKTAKPPKNQSEEKRRYSEVEIRNALHIAITYKSLAGAGVNEAGRQTGIMHSTISKWIKKYPQLVAEITVDVEAKARANDRLIIDRIIEVRNEVIYLMRERLSNKKLRAKISNSVLPAWFGVLTEKALLLDGKATGRVEGTVKYLVGIQEAPDAKS